MLKLLLLRLKWFKKKLKWDYKYRKGTWDYMGNEKKRYDVIVNLIKESVIESPRILDLGCGYGALNQYLNVNDYSYLLGIDLSSNAIQRAKDKNYPNTHFQVADIHQFSTIQKFNIIIFNEVLYYLDNQSEIVARFSNYFIKNGFFIFSFYGIREDLIAELANSYILVKKEIISQSDEVIWGICLYKVL